MIYPIIFIQYCESLEVKLTSLRKSVLYVLWQSTKPLKAYEILEELQKTKLNATPPTVYRALIFFVASGIVHKIESIQSYTLCCDPDKHLPSEVLMVCNDCHHVTEVYDEAIRHLVAMLSEDHNFQLNQDAIELKGRCNNCVIDVRTG